MEIDRSDYSKVWALLNEHTTKIAVLDHRIGDVGEHMSSNKIDIGKLESKYEELIKAKLAESEDNTSRSMNLKIGVMAGIFSVITAVVAILPSYW